MIRYVDGWQLHAYVDYGVDGPGEAAISARHLAQDVFVVHRYDSIHFSSSLEATSYIEDQLFAVTGVSSDGTLRF